MSAADLRPDPAIIRAFLAAHGGPVQVVTIDPNLQEGDRGKIEVRLFRAADPAVDWIRKQNVRCNVYFTVNELAPSAQFNRKPKKRDILRMTWAHVDIDPLSKETPEQCKARVLGSLRAFTPRPSLVIASGGGVNALWRLSEPAEVNGHLQDLEGVNIALAKRFGGDHCHNIDRILRCPGTINHPDQKKRAKGRRPVLATLVYAGPEAYTLDQLPPPEQSAGGGDTGSDLPRDLAFAGDLSDLDAAFLTKLNALLGTNPKFKATWKHTRTDLADQSPSGYDAALCSIAARAGWSDVDLAALIFIHRKKRCGPEHIEKARRSDYVARTIALARAGRDDDAHDPPTEPG